MATRFYLCSTSSIASLLPGASIAASSSWNSTVVMVSRRCGVSKRTSPMVTITATSTATTPELHACAQFLSDPLEAQTISGTLQGQIRCVESASAGTGTVAIGARVVSDAGTVRGTLLAVTGAALDYATSLTNRMFAGGSSSSQLALSSVVAVRGDRLVFEVGTRDADSSTSRTYSISIGDDNASDLPGDQTTTTANNPWIELSGTITFMSHQMPVFTTGSELQTKGDIVASGPVPRGPRY